MPWLTTTATVVSTRRVGTDVVELGTGPVQGSLAAMTSILDSRCAVLDMYLVGSVRSSAAI